MGKSYLFTVFNSNQIACGVWGDILFRTFAWNISNNRLYVSHAIRKINIRFSLLTYLLISTLNVSIPTHWMYPYLTLSEWERERTTTSSDMILAIYACIIFIELIHLNDMVNLLSSCRQNWIAAIILVLISSWSHLQKWVSKSSKSRMRRYYIGMAWKKCK